LYARIKNQKKSWVDLIKGHSDGFVIGSDLCDCFEKLGKTMARYNKLIGKLSAEEASNVLYKNAGMCLAGQLCG